MEKTKTLFLLGGYDLEMLTIRDILETNHYIFLDHHLTWSNARLSLYQKNIDFFWAKEPTGTIFGIELENDIALQSDNYHTIDHHNERSDFPSALEQILSICHMPMNRTYQLVAANDKGYIPGMLAIGATPEEINTTRTADRKAQGVTDEDEQLAEKAINKQLKKIGNLTIVKTECSHFSPICDRLYPYQSLLIYNDKEWNYYGNQVQTIKERFLKEYQKGNIFYGGGKNGFIGSKRGVYSKEEIKEFINNITYELT